MISRLGRRGAFLLTLGVVWILYGYALLTTPVQTLGRLLWIPLEAWAYIWLIGGILGVAFAWCRKAGRDWPGFAGIVIPVIGWASGYVYTWIFYDTPRAWINAAVWAAVSAMTIVVAGWPEPLKTSGGRKGGDS